MSMLTEALLNRPMRMIAYICWCFHDCNEVLLFPTQMKPKTI